MFGFVVEHLALILFCLDVMEADRPYVLCIKIDPEYCPAMLLVYFWNDNFANFTALFLQST